VTRSPPGIRDGLFCARRQLQRLAVTVLATHGPNSWIGFGGYVLPIRSSAMHSRPIGHTGEGIMRFLWNMPTGILFLTTRSPRFAAFLSGTGNHTLSESMTMSIRDISSEPRMPGAPRAADDDRKRRNEPGGPGTAVITKTKTQIKKPSLYRVLLLNDDYTPMEFVVHVLERFFNKDREAATRIMLHVHHHGIGECGIFTYEVAETKVTQVMDFARKHQHPLQCVMEKK
jgi:ATP-dependent Clp protease adaptor protein ClpS